MAKIYRRDLKPGDTFDPEHGGLRRRIMPDGSEEAFMVSSVSQDSVVRNVERDGVRLDLDDEEEQAAESA